MNPRISLITVLLLFGGCTGCRDLSSSPEGGSPAPSAPTARTPSTAFSPAPPTATPKPTLLPPEPRDVTFNLEDGTQLSGTYYPGRLHPSPVVILLHWYPGDQEDWTEIAHWLQNRGLSGPGGNVPWRDPAWFPDIAPEQSYAVVTFTFSGCRGGCQEPDRASWAAQAAEVVAQAGKLPGVDPHRIAAIGASIGGDGAMIGCEALLGDPDLTCRGVLSLSPGNYLGNHYLESAARLSEADPPRPVWCFYDRNDHTADLCQDLQGDHVLTQVYGDGYLHGMHLINPDLDPNPLGEALQFLEGTLEEN